jgi:hypothetical protein
MKTVILFLTCAVLTLAFAGCGGDGAKFVGAWKASNGDSVAISKSGGQFVIEYRNKYLQTVDKLVGTCSGEKMTTSFPLVGETSLLVDGKSGNLIFSGIGEFQRSN